MIVWVGEGGGVCQRPFDQRNNNTLKMKQYAISNQGWRRAAATLRKSKNVTGYISECVNEYTSKYVSEYTSEHISDSTSDYISECISEKSSSPNSQRTAPPPFIPFRLLFRGYNNLQSMLILQKVITKITN